MTAGNGSQATSGQPQKMRAADADRDRAVGLLNTAYTEGRLSKDEYDTRLESALSARTYADLDQVVTDWPAIVVGHIARSQINHTGEQGAGLALAGLILGWAAVILAVVIIVIGLAVFAGTHGTMHMR